jgi:hypothetical protein
VEEPGLDRHQWESEWESLEPLLHDSPAETLSEVDDLVARMMAARGIATEERAGEDLVEPEATREFVEARRVTRVVDSGESYDPGDIAAAVETYGELYVHLLELGPTAGAPA